MTLTHTRARLGVKSESCFTVFVTFAVLRTSAAIMTIRITLYNTHQQQLTHQLHASRYLHFNVHITRTNHHRNNFSLCCAIIAFQFSCFQYREVAICLVVYFPVL